VTETPENAQSSYRMDFKEREAEDPSGKKESVSSQVVHENRVMETGVPQFENSFRRPSFRR